MGHKARISAVVVAIWLIIVVAGCNSEKEATVPVIDTMAQNTESTNTVVEEDASTEKTTSAIKANSDVPDEVPHTTISLRLTEDLSEADTEKLKNCIELKLFVEKENIDISLLGNLEALEKLTIYQGDGVPGLLREPSSYLSDFSFLNNMNIKELALDCGSSNIDLNTYNLKYLESLYLYYADITNDSVITSFPSLKKLILSFSKINTIDVFCSLSLTTLDIYSCHFNYTNANKINEIQTLESLEFSFCNAELTKLSQLRNLKFLLLGNGDMVYDIELIYDLTWLEELCVYFTRITDEQVEKYMKINPKCSFVILEA